jgi:large subunit ribosomal protein L18
LLAKYCAEKQVRRQVRSNKLLIEFKKEKFVIMLKKLQRRNKIRRSIRKKLHGTAERPRLSVYRSNKAIYAQIVNDDDRKTLVSTSSVALATTGNKVDQSAEVGKIIAEKAKAAGIELVVFDRGGFLYHGRVKALAEAAREGGLKF